MDLFTNFFNRNRIILKSFLIAILSLILLIPAVLIQNLVTERQGRQREAVMEISSKWAGSQTVTGPVIGVPYWVSAAGGAGNAGTAGNTAPVSEKKWAYFLPDKLQIQSRIVPEKRYRGIYEVIVYTTELQIRGSYESLHIAELDLSAGQLLWNEAALFFDISDVQGLKDDLVIHLAGKDLSLVPGKYNTEQFKQSLSAAFPDAQTALQAPLSFSATVQLKGSGHLQFVPIGKETKVDVVSSWSDPSFTGTYLPDVRTVRDSGFTASWKVLYLNRNFPQQWKDSPQQLRDAAFGVNLIVPVDSYLQTTRSVKYAILLILLTFTTFFLIEWIYAKAIHSLQYLLVGFALCLFYTLLLSFSEYIGFNKAYMVASLATIGLISWYVRGILRSGKMSFFVGALLVLLYGFIYTLIQLQDYALLMGSIGLFITLGVVMYFSRKIKWEANHE